MPPVPAWSVKKQKKLTPLDRGPSLHVNRVLLPSCVARGHTHEGNKSPKPSLQADNPYLSYSSLLNKIRFKNYNAQYTGRMYHVVHLLLFFCFAGTTKKGLLNFVSERIIFLKLVYRINNTRYSFKKKISCLSNL